MKLAIVGATGAVGQELLRVLEAREFPVTELRLFASAKSAGKHCAFRGEQVAIETISPTAFDGLDIAFFSAGSETSKELRKQVVDAGCIMIDNSSAFRMDADVPLVIPEINAVDLQSHQGVIAVPNCSTIIMLMAVAPLRKFGKIKRIVVSTYQAVSGAGAKAMKELERQSRAYLAGEDLRAEVLPHPIAFNLFCHNAAVNEHGYNGEEWKMIHETKKILHDESIAVTATCVRVPVFRAHSEAINIEFEGLRPSVTEVWESLATYPGVQVVDDAAKNYFPMPKDAAGRYDVLVGHVRHDASNERAIDLFASGDQLLKGAALDAVQIAESLLKLGLVKAQ
ncbi:MAG: aspartate-semialdehyde dehydrogenase [Bacteroidota bacterium]|nr:aspartate-semialdehyde dehydrogenase [Bacteroidota bacterium]